MIIVETHEMRRDENGHRYYKFLASVGDFQIGSQHPKDTYATCKSVTPKYDGLAWYTFDSTPATRNMANEPRNQLGIGVKHEA